MHDADSMLPIHAMKRAILCLLLLLGLAGAGCATDYAERYRLAHPGWTPRPPVAGDSLEETLASLQTGPGDPFNVSVRELRALRVDVEPWETLSVDSAVAGPAAQTIAAIADRRCKGRQGIHFFDTERVSWFLFVAGGLVSYDHFEFGDACEPHNHYLPSRAEHLATEQALTRDAARRYPESTHTTEEMLSRGMALVSVGRIPEAKRMLRSVDREIDFMWAEIETSPQDEKESLEAEERQLKAMRAKLSKAIVAAEKPKGSD
jgi:hypothetical protein